MRWPRAVGSELLGLFVDDARFAGAIVAWLLAAGSVLPRLGLPAGLAALVWFAGFAAILIAGALRRARRR